MTKIPERTICVVADDTVILSLKLIIKKAVGFASDIT